MTVFCIIASKACKLIIFNIFGLSIIESPKMLSISFVEVYLCYIKHSQVSLLTVTRMEMVQLLLNSLNSFVVPKMIIYCFSYKTLT